MESIALDTTSIGVGFGTAALGSQCFSVVLLALAAGFRKFDTAEADWWYDQAAVGRALESYSVAEDDECVMESNEMVCGSSLTRDTLCSELRISTKIPPWELTSAENIRSHAHASRQELLGFCPNTAPLDVYYIHAPACWKGWHPRCDNHPPTLPLRESWMAMEAVVGLDGLAQRIGLSNVHPNELLDIIHFVEQRKKRGEMDPPPRIPDAVQIYADPIQPAEEIRKICQDHNIEFVSYSTLGSQHRNTAQNPVLTSPIVQHLATKHARSTAEVVLSWALQNTMSVIPRSSKKEHIEELARLLNDTSGFLEYEDLQQMDRLKNSA